MDEKIRIQRYIKFLIYLIVTVLINVAGITLFSRIDLTENRVYSLSQASKRVVSTLSEPLTIKVFFSKNLPAPYNNTERYLHDLLEEYAIHANRYFNYRFYDVSPHETDLNADAGENQQTATNYGIYPVQIQNIEKDEVKFQKAYMGMVIIHGDMIEKIPTITTTDGLEYQLTTSIQKLNNKISALLNLKENIQIKLYLSSSLKTIAPYMQLNELSNVPDKLKKIVENLNAKTFGKLSFEYYDPSKDDKYEADIKRFNLLNLSWPAIAEKNIKPGSGSVGLVMSYGDKALSIPIVNVMKIPLFGTQYSMVSFDELEEIIDENIESLIEINADIGYLADHGTLEVKTPMMNPLQPEQGVVSNFRNLVSQNYTIRDVHLKDGAIPDSFNCLIIAGAKEPFSDYELFQIDQYLMRGKRLALFLESFNEITPPRNQPYPYNQGPRFVPIDTGLEKLLEHYGIRFRKSYVMDENCFRQMSQVQRGGGETPIYFAPIIKNKFINDELDFIKDIKELVVMKASPLELDDTRIEENGLNAFNLISSSEKSWEMSGRINLNPRFIHPPSAAEMHSMPLAYMLEGSFPSYFSGKPIPEKEKGEPEDAEETQTDTAEAVKPDETLAKIKGEGQIITQGKTSMLFLIATSEILKNNMVDAEGRSTNAIFLMNVLDALNGRNEIAIMRSKEQRLNPLAETTPAVKMFIKTFNMAGLPIFVVAFGLLVLFRRHSKQKKIRLMFQK